jgi:hypothetical protein
MSATGCAFNRHHKTAPVAVHSSASRDSTDSSPPPEELALVSRAPHAATPVPDDAVPERADFHPVSVESDDNVSRAHRDAQELAKLDDDYVNLKVRLELFRLAKHRLASPFNTTTDVYEVAVPSRYTHPALNPILLKHLHLDVRYTRDFLKNEIRKMEIRKIFLKSRRAKVRKHLNKTGSRGPDSRLTIFRAKEIALREKCTELTRNINTYEEGKNRLKLGFLGDELVGVDIPSHLQSVGEKLTYVDIKLRSFRLCHEILLKFRKAFKKERKEYEKRCQNFVQATAEQQDSVEYYAAG